MQQCGDELEATGLQKLPRNLQQIKNYRRTGHAKDGTAHAFVRDIKLHQIPSTLWPLIGKLMIWFAFLQMKENSVFLLLIPLIYNLVEFYVTPVAYKHLMLVDIISEKHPTIAGLILVHQWKKFAAFNYFASTLISFNKKLQGLLAFGTDGDEALIEAFLYNFPFAMQLHCFLHMKKYPLETWRKRAAIIRFRRVFV